LPPDPVPTAFAVQPLVTGLELWIAAFVPSSEAPPPSSTPLAQVFVTAGETLPSAIFTVAVAVTVCEAATPAGPVAPAGPVWPVGPCGPCGPCGPVAPVAPLVPFVPAGPVAPVAPLVPFVPAGPVAPVAPLVPLVPLVPL